MKIRAVAFVLLLQSLPLLAEDPWLTAEKCAKSEPDALYVERLHEVGLAHDSEQARDAFHEKYAVVLAAHTDQKFPSAAKIRKPLLDAFKKTLEFIRIANGNTSVSHHMSRLPAEFEWMLHSGFSQDFDLGISGEFTFEDLRDLARIYQKSQRRFTVGDDLGDLPAKHLEPAIKNLQEAEAEMSDRQVLYFRAKLVDFITQYLRR